MLKFNSEAIPYVIVVLVALIVFLGSGLGGHVYQFKVLSSHSEAGMKSFEQKLAAVQPGDLLIMVPMEVEQLPLMYQVNDSLQHGGIRVVDITGRDPVYAGSISLTPVSRFIDYHRSIGVVHIIPKDKAEVFYRGILSSAPFVAVR